MKDTAQLYDVIYHQNNLGSLDFRYREQVSEIQNLLALYHISPDACVVELGAGVGDLHNVHPHYLGLEHSLHGVMTAKVKYGEKINIQQADATALTLEDQSVDFLFSYATLEHIPEIDKAMQEIIRILKPGGYAFLAPAWNCRPWTVEKLPQLAYSELTWKNKIGKFLIPLREHVLFRFARTLPQRLLREVRCKIFGCIPLDWQALQPNFALIQRFSHVADDDAFVNMDAHAAMCWYYSKGFRIVSHPSFFQRLFCRGEPILIQKPLHLL